MLKEDVLSNLEMNSEQTARPMRMAYDKAHGEWDAPEPLKQIAKRHNFEITILQDDSITADSLRGSNLLYLMGPSEEFTAEEKDNIISFVEAGGSLLLVMDEDCRQNLAKTGVNDVIIPFGMKFTPDTEYLHNQGAIAKAGEINKADREVPFSGGRAVEGGIPFAFQLDKDGKTAQPYAAYKKLDNGARLIIMGEAMAAIFMGTEEGERLSGVPRDPSRTTYWGKDSAIFMEEVLMWLLASDLLPNLLSVRCRVFSLFLQPNLWRQIA